MHICINILYTNVCMYVSTSIYISFANSALVCSTLFSRFGCSRLVKFVVLSRTLFPGPTTLSDLCP